MLALAATKQETQAYAQTHTELASTVSANEGSTERITKILLDLKKEMEARGKAEEAKDKAEDAKESALNKAPSSSSPATPCPPANDGMTQLKEFFSGEQGLKRSETFLKFAKMITDGGISD